MNKQKSRPRQAQRTSTDKSIINNRVEPKIILNEKNIESNTDESLGHASRIAYVRRQHEISAVPKF